MISIDFIIIIIKITVVILSILSITQSEVEHLKEKLQSAQEFQASMHSLMCGCMCDKDCSIICIYYWERRKEEGRLNV